MSGVYIKGIEMPKGLAERGFVIRGDGRVRTFAGAVYDDALAFPVPDHGRLIDADELFKEFERKAWHDNADRDRAEDILLDAPTIIQADVSDTDVGNKTE